MKCSYCDTPLRKESRFCMNCGKKVNIRDCYIKELETSGKALTRKTDTESLNNIITLTKKIWKKAENNPDLEDETRDLFKRYLPMITDVVTRYKEVKKNKSKKHQLDTVRDDLTEVLNTTERALEIMLEELYEKEILELELNIETLQRFIESSGRVDPKFDFDAALGSIAEIEYDEQKEKI